MRCSYVLSRGLGREGKQLLDGIDGHAILLADMLCGLDQGGFERSIGCVVLRGLVVVRVLWLLGLWCEWS